MILMARTMVFSNFFSEVYDFLAIVDSIFRLSNTINSYSGLKKLYYLPWN